LRSSPWSLAGISGNDRWRNSRPGWRFSGNPTHLLSDLPQGLCHSLGSVPSIAVATTILAGRMRQTRAGEDDSGE
jgi:hypothetical protein